MPEGVSSAGAVIVDSVEHYARDYFAEATPAELYEFTRQVKLHNPHPHPHPHPNPNPKPKPNPSPDPNPNPNPYPSQTVKAKTGELLQLSSRLGVPPSLVLPLAAAPTDAEPIGTQFAAWAEARKAWP